ncbi:MAG: sulfatase-like hydrolase/transferase, partial [Armatimonadetes bacterium]|nr:sulfatase-like hydrolase/transferase [Armatimonadota bacterium]
MRINRREFLRQVGWTSAALAAGRVVAGGEARQPFNVLYIMTDQQPVSCASPYGLSPVQTPNLQRIADEGCRLDHMYIAAFPCSPSRACMLTGRYLHHHRVIQNDVPLEDSVPALSNLLKAAGYDTGYFGKWHLGGHMYRGREDRRGKGLGGNWYYERTATEQGWRCKPVAGGHGEDEPQHGFDVWAGGWENYHQWLRQVGRGDLLKRFPGLGNHNDAPSGPEGTHMVSQVDEDHHVAAFIAGQAERFVRARAGGRRPWFAVVSFYGPHLPVAPPRPWDDMYSLDRVTLPANHNDSLVGKPVRQQGARRNYVLPRWSDDQFKDYIRRYWGYCAYLDHQIGRVLQALRDTGQWENTIVVFTSDHGDMLTAHGMIWKLGTCGYEELYNVPTLVRIPGVTRPGSSTGALVSNVDLLPTLLGAVGVDAPQDIDGRSFLPVLRGERDTHREMVFSDCSNSSLICRDEKYKFVLNWRNRDMDELYDLEHDPGEMKNLAYDDKYEAVARRMRKRILRWTGETHHRYASLIATEAAKKPVTKALYMSARVGQFKYLGGNEFEMEIIWHVDRPIEVTEGKYWAFTQFLNPKYGTDGQIVFRFTPYPDPPFRQWQAGKDYHIGPVRVKVPDNAGTGEYRIRTGIWDPKAHRGPGVIVGGEGNAVSVGRLMIKREQGKIVSITYK